VQGTFNSATNASFLIDLYLSATGGTPGKAEPLVRFGTLPVTTDGSGNAIIAATLPAAVSPGLPIAATAMDANNNTSEFSPSISTVEGTVPVPLSVAHENGAPTLRWSSAAVGYMLECTADLRPPVQWQTVTNGIVNDGTTTSYAVTNYSGSTNRFYRLRKQ
jgi:hypothetical protein